MHSIYALYIYIALGLWGKPYSYMYMDSLNRFIRIEYHIISHFFCCSFKKKNYSLTVTVSVVIENHHQTGILTSWHHGSWQGVYSETQTSQRSWQGVYSETQTSQRSYQDQSVVTHHGPGTGGHTIWPTSLGLCLPLGTSLVVSSPSPMSLWGQGHSW